MRDFRDAKAMAQTLREALTSKNVVISHSESLEFVSRMLGTSDWNTLSALLQAERQGTGIPNSERAVTHPAIPIRDLVPFPATTFPLFVAREKTKHAIDKAFAGNREVVLAVQRDSDIVEPDVGDVYEVGVLARLLEVERLPAGAMFRDQKMSEGTMKILVTAHRRVTIRRFVGNAGAYQAEVADISEGPIPRAPELIQMSVERFEKYASDHELNLPPQMLSTLGQIRDPGRVADAIAPHLVLPITDKQTLLATIDSVERLERIGGLLEGVP